MPYKKILQRSIIHMYPFECSEEKRSKEIPNKINLNQKINRKRERAEMHQRDKMRQHPKKRAPVAAGSKILGQSLMNESFTSQPMTFCPWWECRAQSCQLP